MIMKKTVNLTAAGKADLEQELAELIGQRPAIAERIAKNTLMLVPNKKMLRIAFWRFKKFSRMLQLLKHLRKLIKLRLARQ